MRLKPFGDGGHTREYGYDLPLLVGHLEALVSSEEDNLMNTRGPKSKRFERVEVAVAELLQVLEEYPEE